MNSWKEALNPILELFWVLWYVLSSPPFYSHNVNHFLCYKDTTFTYKTIHTYFNLFFILFSSWCSFYIIDDNNIAINLLGYISIVSFIFHYPVKFYICFEERFFCCFWKVIFFSISIKLYNREHQPRFIIVWDILRN